MSFWGSDKLLREFGWTWHNLPRGRTITVSLDHVNFWELWIYLGYRWCEPWPKPLCKFKQVLVLILIWQFVVLRSPKLKPWKGWLPTADKSLFRSIGHFTSEKPFPVNSTSDLPSYMLASDSIALCLELSTLRYNLWSQAWASPVNRKISPELVDGRVSGIIEL